MAGPSRFPATTAAPSLIRWTGRGHYDYLTDYAAAPYEHQREVAGVGYMQNAVVFVGEGCRPAGPCGLIRLMGDNLGARACT